MSIDYSPGILTLTSASSSSVLNIELNIPSQVLHLRGYRVEYDTAANALADRIIYVELPFLSRNQIIDNNIGRVYLPIQLDNAVVTLRDGLDLQILMTESLPERFHMNVYDSSFNLVTNMAHISLTFGLERGHLR
jgi:hypothetical protein